MIRKRETKKFDLGIKFGIRLMVNGTAFYPGRLAFHGKRWIDSYHNQKEETQPYIDWVAKERIPKWLKYFEEVLKRNNDGQGLVLYKIFRFKRVPPNILLFQLFIYQK